MPMMNEKIVNINSFMYLNREDPIITVYNTCYLFKEPGWIMIIELVYPQVVQGVVFLVYEHVDQVGWVA